MLKIYHNAVPLAVFIFFLSVFFSVSFLLFFQNIGPIEHQAPGTDYFERYQPVANSLLEGKGFRADGKIIDYSGPGFSVILAGIFFLSRIMDIDKFALIEFFNIIFTAFATCLLFFIIKEIFDKKIALIASFLWMTYPFNLWFLKNPNTEVPFILLLYLGIFLYILSLKKKSSGLIFLTGVLLGLVILTRLIGLFLPLVFLLMLFFFLKKEKRKIQILFALFMLAGVILSLLPWLTYLFLNTGSSIPVSNLGSKGADLSFRLLLKADGVGYGINFSDQERLLLEKLKAVGESAMDSVYPYAISEFVKHPLIFMKITILLLSRAWYATYMMWWEDKILLVQSFYLIPAIAGIIYGIKNYQDKIIKIIFLLAIIFFFWLMASIFGPIVRYMVPVMGFVIGFSAVAWDALINKFNFYGKISLRNNSLQK